MKTLRTTFTVILCMALWLGATSCVVFVKKSNGKGWNKNSNNPHHPRTTNPGKAKKH